MNIKDYITDTNNYNISDFVCDDIIKSNINKYCKTCIYNTKLVFPLHKIWIILHKIIGIIKDFNNNIVELKVCIPDKKQNIINFIKDIEKKVKQNINNKTGVEYNIKSALQDNNDIISFTINVPRSIHNYKIFDHNNNEVKIKNIIRNLYITTLIELDSIWFINKDKNKQDDNDDYIELLKCGFNWYLKQIKIIKHIDLDICLFDDCGETINKKQQLIQEDKNSFISQLYLLPPPPPPLDLNYYVSNNSQNEHIEKQIFKREIKEQTLLNNKDNNKPTFTLSLNDLQNRLKTLKKVVDKNHFSEIKNDKAIQSFQASVFKPSQDDLLNQIQMIKNKKNENIETNIGKMNNNNNSNEKKNEDNKINKEEEETHLNYNIENYVNKIIFEDNKLTEEINKTNDDYDEIKFILFDEFNIILK
jgi:hypothetical protein